MAALIATILAVAVSGEPVPADAVKSAHELREAIHAALVAEAGAETQAERLAAVARIVRLYGDLKDNPHIAFRDRVRLRTKLRSRLRRVAADMKRDLGKTNSEKIESAIASDSGASGGQAQSDPGKALVELIESTIRTETWTGRGGRGVVAVHAPGRVAGDAGAGGGGGFGGGIGGGGGVNSAAAQAESLIELIQTTIRPETWEVNGGRGTIMYWPH
jgi:hypothetical protein